MSLSAILLSGLSLLLGNLFPTPSITPQPSPLPTREEKTVASIEIDSVTYGYEFIGPLNPHTISLHSNLPDKKGSDELMKSHECNSLINGGFYSKSDTHIGLFLTDNITRTEQSQNALFNGLIAITQQGKAAIGTTLPDENLSFALQSGPILMEDGFSKQLRIKNDENARRMIVGLSENGSIYLLSVFFPNNFYGGPLLGDLPKIVKQIEEKEKMQLISALNLDGGNHSAFISNSFSLTELSPIGSFFCIK